MQKIYVFSRPQTPKCPEELKGKNHKSYKEGSFIVFIQNDYTIFICKLVSQKG